MARGINVRFGKSSLGHFVCRSVVSPYSSGPPGRTAIVSGSRQSCLSPLTTRSPLLSTVLSKLSLRLS